MVVVEVGVEVGVVVVVGVVVGVEVEVVVGVEVEVEVVVEVGVEVGVVAEVVVGGCRMMDRNQWLRDRQSGIGASDAPCIVGLGWKTAADIYRSKIDPIDERPPTGPMQRGIVLEPIVAQMYAEAMGVELAPGKLYRHPERPWQLATLDYTRPDNRDLELKTVAYFGDEWGPTGSDIIPDDYRVQTQHQMGVRGCESCDLAALSVVTWELRIYRLELDNDFFKTLTRIESQFWGCVTARIPLGPDWDQNASSVMRWKDYPAKSPTVLGADVAALIAERQTIRDVIREANAASDDLTNEIRRAMGEASAATCGTWKLKQTRIPGSRVEYDREPYTRLDIRPIKPGKAKRMYAVEPMSADEMQDRYKSDIDMGEL